MMQKQQRGGTLLGLVIGVVIGLGAALAVAVYVTKVPVPFVNKSPPRKADQDAAEALKNKDWDPNVQLQNKGARNAASAALVTFGEFATNSNRSPSCPPINVSMSRCCSSVKNFTMVDSSLSPPTCMYASPFAPKSLT